MIYLKFAAPRAQKVGKAQNAFKVSLQNFAIGTLKSLVPRANPDYDHKIKDVCYWIVEINEQTNLPNREIGLDKDEQVIMILPDKRNYGYWVDNTLSKDDFESHFGVEKLSAEAFNQLWDRFSSVKK